MVCRLHGCYSCTSVLRIHHRCLGWLCSCRGILPRWCPRCGIRDHKALQSKRLWQAGASASASPLREPCGGSRLPHFRLSQLQQPSLLLCTALLTRVLPALVRRSGFSQHGLP